MLRWPDTDRLLALGALLVSGLAGCDDGPVAGPVPPLEATATSAPTAPVPTATAPQPKAYEGPTGTVKGKITVTGDPSPTTPFKYPTECSAAAGTYGKLFRVGQDGGLADALVTVTEYEGFVPPKKEAVELTIKNCAYSQRTVALTHGQHLEVRNLDSLTSYLPHLDGARLPAGIVAVPLGEPVKLHTRGVQRYWLRDQMARAFMVAHVFHLPYSTTAVTDLSGEYAIEGVPVGKAKVAVLLPQLMKTVHKDVEVAEGDNVVDIELTFDAATDTPSDGHGGTKPAGVPGAPSPGTPAPSAAPTAAPTGTAAP
jgi:hypothetical protein